VRSLFQRVTVSLDGATRASYRETRGVDAFDAVVDGIAALVEDAVWVSLRTTVQKRNFREMPEIVRLGRRLGVREISFLPVDVRSRLAFGRSGGPSADELALDVADLPDFEAVLAELDGERWPEPGLIAESPEKLRRMRGYFAALIGHGDFPPVRCNTPRFSAVVRPDGSVQPCHFIEGHRGTGSTLADELNEPVLVGIRKAIRRESREECVRCVCPMRRGPWEPLLRTIWGD
jgi:Fe-coproporphyrin III synthase